MTRVTTTERPAYATRLRSLAEAVTAGAAVLRDDLERLVRIPSVSADPGAAEHVSASAAETARLFRTEGFDVEILSVPGGLPAVVGRRAGPAGAPTVLLYAHHDVQPTGARGHWHSEPFEPTEREGRLYGRGAADDKAGIAAHLAAIRAHGDALPVTVVVLIEGEEEIGSPTLEHFLATHSDRLAADVLVLADSANWAIGQPALTTSLRGLADCVVEVATLDHALHSGMYGGPAIDAVTALCRLLATLHDDDGNVAVAGLPTWETDPLDLTEERFRAEAGVLDGVSLIGTGSLTQRLWAGPAITVIGFDATPVDDASNSLAPTARAKVSLRVPPGFPAAEALRLLVSHLQSHAPWGARVTVVEGSTGEGYIDAARSAVHDQARAAFADAWDGTAAIDTGIGGSIPFIHAFAGAFPRAEILVTGVEDPESRAHGADESLHLGEFARVCLAEALLLERLGTPAVENLR